MGFVFVIMENKSKNKEISSNSSANKLYFHLVQLNKLHELYCKDDYIK